MTVHFIPRLNVRDASPVEERIVLLLTCEIMCEGNRDCLADDGNNGLCKDDPARISVAPSEQRNGQSYVHLALISFCCDQIIK